MTNTERDAMEQESYRLYDEQVRAYEMWRYALNTGAKPETVSALRERWQAAHRAWHDAPLARKTYTTE
jgi:protein involved in temperature-dependent protein secretion